jgi:precorrin-6A/cobalt-precorrin-6A reductase
MRKKQMRILILGGTREASMLVQRLSEDVTFQPIVSFAGRTENPVLPPIPFRIGGFGGSDGLYHYLMAKKIDAVIDATHPFAVRISENASSACRRARVPLAAFTRPAWEQQAGDRWIVVDDVDAAVRTLAGRARRILLTHGRLQLSPFARLPQHTYIVRAIDRPVDIMALPRHRLILARGPFARGAEVQLMRDERIDVIVSKNSGGSSTYAKIEAARDLGIPVVMMRRPQTGVVAELFEIDAVMSWLDTHRAVP